MKQPKLGGNSKISRTAEFRVSIWSFVLPMRVISNLEELGEPWAPSVVTVGNFDGVHLAHQTLLRRVVEVARRTGLAGNRH